MVVVVTHTHTQKIYRGTTRKWALAVPITKLESLQVISALHSLTTHTDAAGINSLCKQ